MRDIKLIFKYSFRLVKTEWKRFVLPFLSLFITAIVLMLILLLTASSKGLIDQQARDLLGGDVVIEASSPVNLLDVWQEIEAIPDAISEQISFTGSVLADGNAIPASILVIDDYYPLYGKLILDNGEYTTLADTEILLDSNAADKLNTKVGDSVTFAGTRFFVSGIIVDEPTSLVSGFKFFPQVIISNEGFARVDIDPNLLNADYKYANKFENLNEEAKVALREIGKESVFRVSLAENSQSGLQFGLEVVAKFLIIAVLITSVLAAVNIYASIVYLITTLRKSLAIFLALGMKRISLLGIFATSLSYVVLLSSLFGVIASVTLFKVITNFVTNTYAIELPTPDILVNSLITLGLIFIVALGAFIPVARKSLSISPKQILLGGDRVTYEKNPKRNLLLITISSLLPLVLFASFVLDSVTSGAISILVIVFIYVLISIVFYVFVALFYKFRKHFSFFSRSIIIYKKADGLFGIISFTSLFVALAALCTLSLIQISLEKYLTDDLSSSLPTTYVIDIQPSQKDAITEQFPDLELFSNLSSRIIEIDGLRIQDELAAGSEDISRELGREFNLTYRTELLESEEIVAGSQTIGLAGELSVDEAFAKQANIELGSEVEFLIQGFSLRTTVTSLRSSDSRSGLPFFYFVLSPDDIAKFPSTYFGYSNYDPTKQTELSTFLASDMPNVLVIETQALSETVVGIIATLTTLVLIVTAPPLFIATLLIITLIISSYSNRRKEGARLRALGATRRFVLWQYLVETIFLTLIAAATAYLFSVIISYGINIYFLEFDSSVWFDKELVFSLLGLIALIGLTGWYLSFRDTMPLRELLSYEQNI